MLKLYWTLWTAIAASALMLWASGNFTTLTFAAYGFISFAMIFMGMISVLPSTVVHHAAPAKPKVKPERIGDEKGIFHAHPFATR